MKKSGLLFIVYTIVLLSVSFWCFVGFKIMKTVSNKEDLIKCITILASKYENIRYREMQRQEDSSIVRNQSLYDVQHYNISLSFNIPKKYIFGNVEMNSLSLSDTLNNIYINFSSAMKVNGVTFQGKAISYEHVNDYIIIAVKNKIKRTENFSVAINYEGSPENKSFDSFGFKTFDDEPAVYTLSEPDQSSSWWPCKDLTFDKFTFGISMTVPNQLTAVSNGLLKEVKDEPEGNKTFRWESNYPIATYLVSIAIAKYDTWSDVYLSKDSTKMNVDYYTYPSFTERAKSDWKNTVSMIAYFSDLFGEYPFIKEKYGMAMFGWVAGAMEHQTISSMGYTLVTGTGRYEDVIVHELVHQWFGDAVTPESWKDIWLNEGFATYGEALWIEHNKGKDDYISFMKKSDYGYFQGTVYDPGGFIFGPTVYNKGAWCLHMLRGVVGDSVFFKIVRAYYEKFKYKNANTWDFKKVCEDVSGTDLTYFFNQWIFTATGRPVYKFSWKADDYMDQKDQGFYTLRLNLRQTQEEDDIYKMPVKVMVKTDKGTEEFTFFNDKKVQQFEQPVTGKPLEVTIDNENWILKKIEKEDYKDRY